MRRDEKPSRYDNQDLRERPSIPFGTSDHPTPEEFTLFVAKRVLPLVSFSGYKLADQHTAATAMIHALVLANERGQCVADSRDTADANVRTRVRIWQAIEDAGLAVKALGSESSGMVTRYQATPRLMKLRKRWHLEMLVDLKLHRNTEVERATPHGLVYMHTGKFDSVTGEPLPSKYRKQGIHFKHFCSELGLEMVQAEEDIVAAFNDNVLQHSWLVKITDRDTGRRHSSPLNPCLRQIHCGGWYRAARYHSWTSLSGQLLSKEQRQQILIDGEPVAELDFSASQLRMLYHLKGIDPAGDLYRPEQIFSTAHKSKLSQERTDLLRGFVKDATLRCLNVKSRKAAHSSIGKLLSEHSDRSYLKMLIKDVEGIDIKGLVTRIVEAHTNPKDRWRWFTEDGRWVTRYGIADRFFEQTGLSMITHEMLIMKTLLQIFTHHKKPALMIHDAVVCKVSDVRFAKKAMIEAYQARVTPDFKPVIKREF